MSRIKESPKQSAKTWKWRALIITHILAALLMLSWLLEPARSWWLLMDTGVYNFFNDSLVNGSDSYRQFWAIVNMQEFDKLVALVLLSIFILHGMLGGRQYWGRHVGIFVAMFVSLGIWTGYGTVTGVGQLLPVERLSATLEFTDSFRMTEWATIKTKDASADSFPGDHGMILIIVAGFIAYYFSRSYAWFAAITAIAGTMPRVVVGAHWFTDEVVGAVFIAMLALSWNFHTPIGGFIVYKTEQIINYMLGKLGLLKQAENNP